MKKTILLLLLTISGYSFSQTDTAPVITINPYGYVSYEVIYDTYRSLDTRDGELYLFPKRPVLDANGNDINKRPKLNMLSVHSRFGFDIKGPDVFGAKTSGRIEADFFGTQQEFVRLLRLRVAFITLKWEGSELLMGNTIHPMFVLDCSPSTVSFAAAVPFHPLNRSPQVRFTQNLTDDLTASLSFLVHGYHSSAGPRDQQRNSGLPDSQLQVRYNSGSFLLGATAGYKFLSPRDITAAGVATSKNVGSFNLQAFTKISTQPFTLKLEGVYGENMSNYIMIGGYGAKGTNTEENPFDWNADYDYANLRTVSFWADIHTNNLALEWGLFAGYTENLGSSDPFLNIAGLQRYTDLQSLFRVSPRVFYTAKNMSFGLEYSYYSAVYALNYDQYGKPADIMDPAINNHIVLMARYNFR